MKTEEFSSVGSLYKSLPLKEKTTVLMEGTVAGQKTEPVVWTYERPDGGRTFYTSLGHPKDFESRVFVKVLRNGVYWAAGVSIK